MGALTHDSYTLPAALPAHTEPSAPTCAQQRTKRGMDPIGQPCKPRGHSCHSLSRWDLQRLPHTCSRTEHRVVKDIKTLVFQLSFCLALQLLNGWHVKGDSLVASDSPCGL